MQEIRRDFYVYGVYLKEDNRLFYIGKGTGKRIKSYSKSDRSKGWFDFVNGREFYSVILFSGLSNKEALEKEKELISIVPVKLINNKLSSVVIDLDFNAFDSLYYLDSTSPSGLRWKQAGGRGPYTHKKGDVAGSFMKSTGYWTVVLNKRRILSHRVVYLLSNKSISSDYYIDHIDGDTSNNNIENLRQVSPSENARNKTNKKKNNLPPNMYIAKNTWNGSKTKQENRLVFKYTDISGKSRQKSVGLSRFNSLEMAVSFLLEFINENLKDILINNNYTTRHFNLEK